MKNSLKSKKITIISNFDLENGRGPIFRLINILPYINQEVDLHVIVLGEPDEKSKLVFDESGIWYESLECQMDGWFVRNPKNLAQNIVSKVIKEQSELCVLEWELWDVAVQLCDEFEKTECKFGVVFHSMPFVDAIPFPTTYEHDIIVRIQNETNKMIRQYLISRRQQAQYYIEKLNVISINETITYYLKHYFPKKHFYKAYPGYALDFGQIQQAAKHEKIIRKYDFCFMAKLEKSKGIFDLIDIAKEIIIRKQDSKLLIIGNFLYENEKKQIEKKIVEYGLEENIVFCGWQTGREKYVKLQQCKVLLYPSLSGDTFSFCLLEALACGQRAVCYNTPFVRIIYQNAPVKVVEYQNRKEFAMKALQELKEYKNGSENSSVKFVENNYSNWKKVAMAEVDTYARIIENEE